MAIESVLKTQAQEIGALQARVTDLSQQIGAVRIAQFPKQAPITSSGRVDLSRNEQGAYSLSKAIYALWTGDWREAGLEREVSQAIAKHQGRELTAGQLLIPSNLETRAAYNVGTATQGGNLVATNLMAGSFIEALTNQLAIMQAGSTTLSGLVGNCDVPKRTGRATAGWVTEGSAIPETEGSFGTVQLRPRQVGALSKFTRLALQQTTPDVEMLVRSDLITQMALAIDYAGLFGDGTSGSPTGIANISGVNSLAMGTNGGQISIDALIDLRSKIATANANAAGGTYLLNEASRAALMKTKNSYGEYYFAVEGNAPGTVQSVFGNPIVYSNQLPSTLTKGTATSKCSAAIFGDFSQLLFGMWGATELLVNPYAQDDFAAGNVAVRAFQTVDFQVRQPAAFAVCKDFLTA